MTQYEFLTAVSVLASGETPMNADSEVITNEEIIAHATAEIAKIKSRNEKAAAKRAEKKAEDQPLFDAALAALTSTPQTASDIKDKLEVSVQKASSILRKLVANGDCQVTEVKIPKKGVQKAYYL